MSLVIGNKKVDLFGNAVVLTIVELLAVISPRFRVFGQYTWLLAALGLVLLVTKIGIDSVTVFFIGLFVADFGLSVLTVLINETSEIQYFIFLLGTLLTFLRAFVVIFLIDRRVNKDRPGYLIYINTYINTCIVYVFFTLMFIVAPGFKSFWFSKVIDTPVIRDDFAAYQFRYSIDGFAAFSASTFFSLAVMLSAFLIVNKNNKRGILIEFVKYAIVIVGCFFYGRVCIIAIAISVIYILFCTWDVRKIFKLIIWAAAFAAIGIILLNYLADRSEAFQVWREWAFAIVDQLFSGGEVTDQSVTHLLNDMYFVPEVKTILIGDGMYFTATGGYYHSTDVGFLRAILYFGVGGCLLNYLLPALFVIQTWKYVRDSFQIKFLLIMLLVVFGILELKGEAYQRVLIVIMPVYYLIASDYRRKQQSLNELSLQKSETADAVE